MLKKMFNKLSKKQRLLNDLTTPKALPLGVKEFNEWSDRIIAQAGIPLMEGATTESQKFILADRILNIGATEDFKEDAYFVKVLRKMAVNQIAEFMRDEVRKNAKARLEAEAKAKAEKEAEEALKKDYASSQDGAFSGAED